MNNIGFGLFCFGDETYFKGAFEKTTEILNRGFNCYVLTDNPSYFTKRFNPKVLHAISYDRQYKSYHDKMILNKYILKNHDISILIDSDLDILDYSFIDHLKSYKFNDGVSYIDILLNHKIKKEFISDLNSSSDEWKDYFKIIPEHLLNSQLIWEYFMVVNKNGFNNDFYKHYEVFQLVKEYCDLPYNKDVNGAGEGISTLLACKVTNTPIGRDIILYDLLKDKIKSVSRRFTPKHLLK